jgi:hypothetical protein
LRAPSTLSTRLVTVAAVVASSAAFVASADAASRTWVSGVGDDANPCSRTAPCKTLAGAISKTDASGTIDVLDPAGVGAVTITKAITIDGTGQLGSVLVAGTAGIVITAAPTDDVVIRGMQIAGNGTAAAPAGCPQYAGTVGVSVRSAHSVTIEDSDVSGFSSAAVDLSQATSNTSVLLNGDTLTGSCGQGVNAVPPAGHTASVSVHDTAISNTATGVLAGDGAHVWLSGATVFGNTLGLSTTGSGVIDSYWGRNALTGNTTDGSPTNVLDAPPTPVSTTTTTTINNTIAPPAGAGTTTSGATPVAALSCKVPSLKGLTLSKATSALSAAHCTLGSVTKKTSKKVGKVLSQKKAAGSSLAAGAKVGVTVGKK